MPIIGTIASPAKNFLWAPAGAYDSISSVTLSASASTITFSGIPSTYTHLQIRAIARSNRASTVDVVKLNLGDGSADTAANYSWHQLYGTGAAAGAAAGASASTIELPVISAASATSSIFGTMILDILDYQNLSKYKTVRGFAAADLNGSGELNFCSGNWRSNSSVNVVTLAPRTGTLFEIYSSFALYGVK
jgi:hypothetical protein